MTQHGKTEIESDFCCCKRQMLCHRRFPTIGDGVRPGPSARWAAGSRSAQSREHVTNGQNIGAMSRFLVLSCRFVLRATSESNVLQDILFWKAIIGRRARVVGVDAVSLKARNASYGVGYFF
jgi:hypothetical protein